MAEINVQELNIKLKVDWDKKQVEVAGTGVKQLTEKIKESGEKTKSAQVSYKELANAIGITGLTFGGVIKTIDFFVDTLRKGIQAAIENEVAMSKLSFRLKTLGEKDLEKTTESLEEFTKSLAEASIFQQTEMTQGLETLIKYTGDITSAQKLLIISTKLATIEHKSLNEVITELGTAIAMPEYGMRRLRREYGSLVGDAKNVTEALENISKNLSKTGEIALTSGQKLQKLSKIWKEDIVEKAGKFWLEALNWLVGGIIEVGKLIEKAFTDIFNRLGWFIDKTIGRVIRSFHMPLKMLDEYEKQADKIAAKERERTKESKKNLDELEKKFENVTVKIKKDEEKAAEERKKLEDKINQYLLKRRSETLEGTKELLDKEIQEFKKAGVNKALIEKYYQERIKEIQEKQIEERRKVEEKIKDEIAKIKGDTYQRAKELLEKELEEYRKLGIDKELLIQYEASKRLEIERQMQEELEKITQENFQKQWGWASDVINSITYSFKQGMVEMIDTGNITAESLEQIWERIKKSFINAITAMVAEYVAKMVVITAISGITGLPFRTIAGGMGWGGKGLFGLLGLQEGGIVNKPTVAVIGEKGPEAVIPLSKAQNFGQHINLNINAFDLRNISQQQIERFARQIKYVLNKELKR
jgi:hypothetical protein